MVFRVAGGRGSRTAKLVICTLMPVLAGCASALEPPLPRAFYEIAPSEIVGPPGEILRSERYAGWPSGSTAYRVLYRSTGLKNEPIAVSGVVVVPEGTVPPGGRPVVAWAHPTTGVATRCAPTLMPELYARIRGVQHMLALGFVVAATDYPGLGTSGTHPYLVGASEGRAVLDSVRAARRLTEARAGATFAVWGHSQGGQAALFAGQLASSYAPELKLAGVAAAAPATDLATLLKDDIDSVSGKVLTAFALWSWNRVYGAPLAPVLDPSAGPAVDQIARECIENDFQDLEIVKAANAIKKEFLHGDVTQIEPWKSLLAQNSAGGAPAGAPVFLAQGTADTTVRPQVTYRFAQQLCGRNTPVLFDWLPGTTHDLVAVESAETAVKWMADRFEGDRAPNQCANLPAEPKVPPKPS